MSTPKYKPGYCKSCLQNIPHFREFRLPVLRLMDVMSLRALRLLQIGPWYCLNCDRRTLFLARRRSASNYEMVDSIDESTTAQQTVGNFLKTDHAIAMRATRLNRFSEKYRDGVVQRIVSGAATMNQIQTELEISETELTEWIGDLFHRMKSRNEHLEQALQTLVPHEETKYITDAQPVKSPHISLAGEGVTLDGQYKPK